MVAVQEFDAHLAVKLSDPLRARGLTGVQPLDGAAKAAEPSRLT
jgi:hypothetical protein